MLFFYLDECLVRLLRVSSVGELGFELHVPKDKCNDVYRSILSAGSKYGLKNAGYRAFYSLQCEKGQYSSVKTPTRNNDNKLLRLGNHLWGDDLRLDSTPVEANLESLCRGGGLYKGKAVVDEQVKYGVKKRLVYITLDKKTPLWGLEGVYRDGKCVGHLQRAEYGYAIDKPIGKCYIKCPEGQTITGEFLESGRYQIDVMSKLHAAKIHLVYPFDPQNHRILGNYE